jgi:hypothetical protein
VLSLQAENESDIPADNEELVAAKEVIESVKALFQA